MPNPLVESVATDTPGAFAVPGALKLIGARVGVDAHTAFKGEVIIEDGQVRDLTLVSGNPRRDLGPKSAEPLLTIDLSGYLILPGLVNAHDHLEFNLLPRLGKGPYPNSERWAQDIYRPHLPPLREHLAIPKPVRLWWGAIKNLLCGVTTVCHHNPYEPAVFSEDFPVRVVHRYAWGHSILYEKDVAALFQSAPPDVPFLIHLGEGTDARSHNEIFELDRLGALDSRTVIIHGVGLTATGRALLEKRGGALVWCPTSNLFTLGTTLRRSALHQTRRIALGSDSALTADGDLLDEIRAACKLVGAEEIFHMVTSKAADVLRLTGGEGTLQPGAVADLIAIPDSGDLPAASIVKASFRQIELVMLAGQPRLFSPTLARRWPAAGLEGFGALQVEDVKRLVRAPLSWLFEESQKHLPAGIWLAGKRVKG